MKRLAILALFAFTATAAAAQTPVLRASVEVSSDLVRIGDLVENASPFKAKIAVFRAPDLGETGTVPTARVLEALRPHDVLGVNTGGLSQISVTRASRIIEATEIRSRIAELLSARMRIADPTNVAIIADTPLQSIHVDPSETGPLMPLRISLERSGRFDIEFKTDDEKPARITGTAGEAYDTLVATRTLNRGDILRASDVTIEKRSKAETQGEPIRDPAAAIGMAIQQALRPGQPIRSGDLAKPLLVKRGEPVVLHYQVPGITLTVRGKAEDGGALGDTVNITNVQSKRTVQGVVSGHGQVTVTSLTPRVVSATINQASHQQVSALAAGR
ncbi:flagellar basal body P-ring formation chaperone FlgA [Pseudorhodoplanes sinuspersici]|uniref:Flagella basal body P-ring formation protein FlgA n=1 Tax=Pseudorhodoplanes sinuspersici TaxID=1235591 RepID=A0A1W6ZUK5_9HYPH|nr:flagellar basal body P-ring formation chaperone FlgA [Pseudorhodoplanes sinuspersici]ARQ00801.1 flagella basal body P-ring formation protein FlgA [Pseudorhodoplanes sinuspersici]RKE72416.1 flagella basal body P-ring formation protein FlgA [Pseudorhodoplanes sinuspersici]